jgi:DNA-directed RNA polymerase
LYPSLKEIYSYFIDSAKLTSELKLPLIWFTPSGLEIHQFYYTAKVNKVKLSYFGKTRTAVLRD